jgi:hypothetical protein
MARIHDVLTDMAFKHLEHQPRYRPSASGDQMQHRRASLLFLHGPGQTFDLALKPTNPSEELCLIPDGMRHGPDTIPTYRIVKGFFCRISANSVIWKIYSAAATGFKLEVPRFSRSSFLPRPTRIRETSAVHPV